MVLFTHEVCAGCVSHSVLTSVLHRVLRKTDTWGDSALLAKKSQEGNETGLSGMPIEFAFQPCGTPKAARLALLLLGAGSLTGPACVRVSTVPSHRITLPR